VEQAHEVVREEVDADQAAVHDRRQPDREQRRAGVQQETPPGARTILLAGRRHGRGMLAGRSPVCHRARTGSMIDGPIMCGIYGGAPERIPPHCASLLAHRGPDQEGEVVVRTADGRPIVIGQTRLSVVYKGDIPTPFARDGAVITFNGEIYNWPALRRELEQKGWRFTTPTDT